MGKVKFKNIVFFVIVWGAIALLVSIALTAALRSGPSALKMPFYTGLAFLMTASLLIYIIYKVDILSKINSGVFLIVLILIALIPRLMWIYYVRTQPFSDFLHIHNYGVSASQGDFKGFVNFYAAFPFKISFGMILAGIYHIFGTGLAVAKLFNVTLSIILVLIIYAGGGMLYSRKAARIAALLAALWPADIMYTSVVASEHLFLVLFTGATLLMLRFIKKYTFKNHELVSGNIILLAVGLLTALAQLIRPMAMLLLPVFAVFVLIYKKYRSNSLYSLGLNVKSIALVVVSYYAIVNLINIPIQSATGVDVARSDSGFNLMVGTNSKYDGMFNDEDFKIIEKDNYDIDKVHSDARQIAFSRLTSDPAQLPRLFVKKFEILWGNENYGYYWSTISSGSSAAETFVKSYPRLFYGISQSFYILVILMAVCSCFYTLIERRYDSLVFLMIFGGILISYMLLEVQSRYHLPVMPLLILFGTGFLPDSKSYDI